MMKSLEHKVGVIPFNKKDARFAVLFVTSQTRGRWILPKGKLRPSESHEEGCKREAMEEAGVTGKALKNFPMTVLITKSVRGKIEKLPVTYYPFIVQEQHDDWPEKNKRERHWALLDDVAKVVSREDYLSLLKLFENLTPWIGY